MTCVCPWKLLHDVYFHRNDSADAGNDKVEDTLRLQPPPPINRIVQVTSLILKSKMVKVSLIMLSSDTK
jgi:hypothetical protein